MNSKNILQKEIKTLEILEKHNFENYRLTPIRIIKEFLIDCLKANNLNERKRLLQQSKDFFAEPIIERYNYQNLRKILEKAWPDLT